MNERLTEGKKTKQQAQAGQSESGATAPEWWTGCSLLDFQISTSAEAKSDSHIMIRDSLKTLKKRFRLVERTRTQEKRGKKGQSRAIFA